jgi:hypothetical protein
MDGHGAFGAAERRKPRKKRLHRSRLLRHYGARRFRGGGGVAGQRQHKGTHAPGRAILACKLILQHRQSTIAITADRTGQGQAPAKFIRVLAPQSNRIVALRSFRITEQVMSKAAVCGQLAIEYAQPTRFVEEAKRRSWLLHCQERCADAGLDAAIAGRDLLGTRIEGDGRLRVAEL